MAIKRSKENGTQENQDQPHPALTLWAVLVAERLDMAKNQF